MSPAKTADELLILAPAEANIVYTNHVRCFVDMGVAFPFGADYSLPRALPDTLDGLRCILLDPRRAAEFETGANAGRLLAFRRTGGHVQHADLTLQVGGTLGDSVVRHYASRIVNTASLTMRNPVMLERLQARDEASLLERWKTAAPDELAQYARMNHPFGDPTGYITFRAVTEAAEFFADPSLAAPVWAFIAAHADGFGEGHRDRCGGRFLLKHYERTGDRRFLDIVLGAYRDDRSWRFNGVFLNRDLTAPDGVDPDNPPALVRDTAWTWPENGAHLGDTLAYLSKVTGDPHWADMAIRHIRQAHHWLFAPDESLWFHVGRPTGPDRRSAPWGRGNGWFLYGVRGLLEDLPDTHPARAGLVDMLRLGLEGLLRHQNARGLWHNVVNANDQESRECASATSRFIHVYAMAYARGWLRDERIPIMLERAWLGLKTKIWDWALIAYCVGTAYGLTRQVYLARPHDTFRCSRSSLLLAWIEMQRMREAAARNP